jgi:hypothetical protein
MCVFFLRQNRTNGRRDLGTSEQKRMEGPRGARVAPPECIYPMIKRFIGMTAHVVSIPIVLGWVRIWTAGTSLRLGRPET